MTNNIFLSIETSISRIFLVINNKGKLYKIIKNVENSIEIELNLLIDKLIKKSNINFEYLDFIVVSLGPGSFTGTRVGLSSAKAISLATGKKLYGYSNFRSILHQAKIEKKIKPDKTLNLLIKSTKYEFYHQKYLEGKTNNTTITDINNIKQMNYQENYYIGNFKNIFDLDNYVMCIPQEESIIETVKEIQLKNNDNKLIPFYVKEHYAKKS